MIQSDHVTMIKREPAPGIPPEYAQDYIADMLTELHGIAQTAQLDEISLLLKTALTVIETRQAFRP